MSKTCLSCHQYCEPVQLLDYITVPTLGEYINKYAVAIASIWYLCRSQEAEGL